MGYLSITKLYLYIFFWGYTPSPKADCNERVACSVKVSPTIALAFLILGGIYTGVFTPTEAAAVGFSLALFLTVVILRSLNWSDSNKAIFDSMITTTAILIIIAGAKVFGKAIALYRIPQDISVLIQTFVESQ